MVRLEDFREIVAVDFEFQQLEGERPVPACLVAHELVSGRHHRLMLTDNAPQEPPYPVGDDVLFISYYASAEIGCHLALGWPMPACVLDLYAEFRILTNGLELPAGRSLLGALVYHGLDGTGAVEKESMRQLATRGGPYTGEEARALMEYCESDVIALTRLLGAMIPNLDVARGILRGRYMKAAARMEWAGIPIDTASLTILREHWNEIQSHLTRLVDAAYCVYDGRTFKADAFARYLATRGITWPTLDSGRLALDDDTFRQMARSYPELEPLRQLRVTLSQMRLSDLTVGSDGRNRCLLSAFAAKTGRNQPSNTRYIFGPAAWMRGLIRPQLGHGLAYIDWSQQEFGIAAALSGDEAMMAAYRSGDPYLTFGKQTGLLAPDATKETHQPVRDQCKQCILAVQYGMGGDSLAGAMNQPVWKANELLRLHRATYPRYWVWQEEVTAHARLRLQLQTAFGWTLNVTPTTNGRTLANFPMQGNGAEMLRLACCLATERGVAVCAPVHDAILIEAPGDELMEAVAITQRAMEEASEIVLDGFCIRSEAKLIFSPNRYRDKKGAAMWKRVWGIIGDLQRSAVTGSRMESPEDATVRVEL